MSTSWKPRGARYCVGGVGRRYIIVRLAAWGWHAPPGASFPVSKRGKAHIRRTTVTSLVICHDYHQITGVADNLPHYPLSLSIEQLRRESRRLGAFARVGIVIRRGKRNNIRSRLAARNRTIGHLLPAALTNYNTRLNTLVFTHVELIERRVFTARCADTLVF